MAATGRGPSGGNGRAGEDELAGHAPTVDFPPHMVPDGRFELPFIDQARGRAIQDSHGVGADHPPSIDVDIQQHLALCRLHGRGRLAGSLGSFHQDRAGGVQQFFQFGINDPGQVRHRSRSASRPFTETAVPHLRACYLTGNSAKV